MSAQTAVLEVATIGQQCKVLHLPAVAAQCAQLAEQAGNKQGSGADRSAERRRRMDLKLVRDAGR